MKYILTSIVLTASIGAAPALANESFSSDIINPEAVQNMHRCLNADIQTGSSKAIRACTKAYKASVPSYDVKSEILTRRGWLKFSAGKYDRAAQDFKSAAKLSNVNELAFLGNGFAALMKDDYAAAIAFFEDCKTHNETAPLAYYGLGMSKELAGDISGAYEAYKHAAKLRPDWKAPREELTRFDT